MSHWLGDGARFLPQGAGDLGERMAGAFEESFRTGSTATVIIGSDCPGLSPDVITAAFARLTETPVVLGPARDGGYYLIGLSRPMPELFRGIPWGTDRVLADSLAVLQRRGCKPALLDPLEDIDRPEDLPAWRRIAASEDACLDRVSVIIPALNEERHIAATLRAVGQSPCHEVIVVDGGSTDATVQRAKEAGVTVLSFEARSRAPDERGSGPSRGRLVAVLARGYSPSTRMGRGGSPNAARARRGRGRLPLPHRGEFCGQVLH